MIISSKFIFEDIDSGLRRVGFVDNDASWLFELSTGETDMILDGLSIKMLNAKRVQFFHAREDLKCYAGASMRSRNLSVHEIK